MAEAQAKRIKWRDRTPENDIKYGGFLSYRHIRIIGWVCMILAQLGLVFSLAAKLSPEQPDRFKWIIEAADWISGMPVPLFMLANFATILQKKNQFRSLLIFYGGAALGLYLLANIVVFKYVFQLMHAVDGTINMWDATVATGEILGLAGRQAYTLNVFIDLLLCVLLFFFANYEPKSQAFAGKKVYLFRALIALPIIYEVGIAFAKYFMMLGYFSVPAFVIFLFPNKPPFVFAAFVIIVICLKISKKLHLKRNGGDVAAYETYTTTRAHSLRVSIMIAIIFAICAALDFGAFLSITLIIANNVANAAQIYGNDPAAQEAAIAEVNFRMEALLNVGIGSSLMLIFISPLALLFSYTKTHKNPKVDKFIPIIGIALMVFTIIEGLFDVMTAYLPKIIEKINGAVDGSGGTEPAIIETISSGFRNIIH